MFNKKKKSHYTRKKRDKIYFTIPLKLPSNLNLTFNPKKKEKRNAELENTEARKLSLRD
jgi:hypothetical protein